MNKKLLVFLLFQFCSPEISEGQDLHFSQFYLNPLHMNPAQTGVFSGEKRFSAIFRNQWASVPVTYQTAGGAIDMKALNLGTFSVNGGFLAQRDQAGDGNLAWTQVGFSGGVAHALGETQAFSAGFSASFVQRAVDFSNLKFKNQWTGEVYDSSLPSKETLAENSGGAVSLGAGINWHLEPGGENRTKIDLGAGAFHLNHPNLNFDSGNDFKLPIRLTINGLAIFQLNNFVDAVGFAALQNMGKNREILFGGGAKYWLKNQVGRKTAVQFSLASRLNDALIPAIQIEQNSWTFGLSYDLNISDFQVATAKQGGVELGLVYRIVPAPPIKNFKACPIF